MIVDARARPPTLRHMRDPIFDSLRRWNREAAPTGEVPVAATVRAMDEAGVAKALISAWVAPRNVMIPNDEVAGFVGAHPDRLVGIGSVDISRPMRAIAEIRRCVEEFGPIQVADFECVSQLEKVHADSSAPLRAPRRSLLVRPGRRSLQMISAHWRKSARFGGVSVHLAASCATPISSSSASRQRTPTAR